VISIDILPDDVLLDIFHFYVDQARYEDGGADQKEVMEAWQALVHVCRRWRCVVFGSPRHLDLRLFCTANTPTRDTVDVWPALPLAIEDHDSRTGSVDNILALLERSDLVRRITQITLLGLSSSQLEDIWEAMQVPFPELTDLSLIHDDETEPVLPLSDSFLGGSAPRLRYLELEGIPYLGLSKLFLSAAHLTELHLTRIPHSGYISPEAMVACISTLTSLEWLSLGFQSSGPHPDQESQPPPPLIRTSLPVLDRFTFNGGGEYLEYLVARIDAPRLRGVYITLFNDIVFVTPQFTRFISHAPILEAFDEATVTLTDSTANINLSSAYTNPDVYLNVGIYCRALDWQLSFLEQVCTSSLPPLSTLEVLYMEGRPWPQDWKDIIDYAQWLDLFYSFTAVEDLYLSKALAPCVVPALEELVGGRTTEVFPNLQNIFVEELQESGPLQEGIEKFVAARQVPSHPIAVSRWDRDSN
jgi:hypothetical protein